MSTCWRSPATYLDFLRVTSRCARFLPDVTLVSFSATASPQAKSASETSKGTMSWGCLLEESGRSETNMSIKRAGDLICEWDIFCLKCASHATVQILQIRPDSGFASVQPRNQVRTAGPPCNWGPGIASGRETWNERTGHQQKTYCCGEELAIKSYIYILYISLLSQHLQQKLLIHAKYLVQGPPFERDNVRRCVLKCNSIKWRSSKF